ncbi:uncharacterized protein N7459_005721 [Penicillium hispanicum]|uniref:uncharacterized protein n=1 Tax=Penicillium hispanicum TaxID=1080232 RepID=UPI00254041A8|nr:uncharacterized protein N7459_005721 [Penicillium hispanicum]KAJ5579736.1 hypothetical protein N7459_005721 [Penicillium hispanicum]
MGAIGRPAGGAASNQCASAPATTCRFANSLPTALKTRPWMQLTSPRLAPVDDRHLASPLGVLGGIDCIFTVQVRVGMHWRGSRGGPDWTIMGVGELPCNSSCSHRASLPVGATGNALARQLMSMQTIRRRAEQRKWSIMELYEPLPSRLSSGIPSSSHSDSLPQTDPSTGPPQSP